MPLLLSPRSTALLGFVFVLLGACSQQVVHDGPGSAVALEGYSTYAWTGAQPQDDLALQRTIREAADRRLKERGFRRVEPSAAELLLEARTDVEVQSKQRDPYFSFYTVIQYEVGKVTLDVRNGRSRALLWSASAKGPLRDVARGFGIVEVRYEPLHEERDWKVEEKVSEIVGKIPTREPSRVQ